MNEHIALTTIDASEPIAITEPTDQLDDELTDAELDLLFIAECCDPATGELDVR